MIFLLPRLDSLPSNRQRSLENGAQRFKEMFPGAGAEAVGFLKECLRFNPQRRISADKSLSHPYVAQFHNPQDEPSCPRPIQIAFDDNTKLSVNDYRDKL